MSLGGAFRRFRDSLSRNNLLQWGLTAATAGTQGLSYDAVASATGGQTIGQSLEPYLNLPEETPVPIPVPDAIPEPPSVVADAAEAAARPNELNITRARRARMLMLGRSSTFKALAEPGMGFAAKSLLGQ